MERLDRFSYHIGLAFQIRDDVLDVIGSTEQLGKKAGSDEIKNKSTYPKLLSLEGAKEKLRDRLDVRVPPGRVAGRGERAESGFDLAGDACSHGRSLETHPGRPVV